MDKGPFFVVEQNGLKSALLSIKRGCFLVNITEYAKMTVIDYDKS